MRLKIKTFVELLKNVKPPLVKWLIFHEEMTTSEKWINEARKYLKDYDHNSNVGSGTNVSLLI